MGSDDRYATLLPGALHRTESRSARTGLFLLQAPVVLLLVLVALVSLYLSVPVSAFMRDPTAIAQINPFNGAIANIGVMLWSVSAGILLFTGMLLRTADGDAHQGGFYFYFGLLTVVLLLDDVFLIHDTVVPSAFAVAEEPVYALYATLLLYGLWHYRDRFWPRGALLFAIACTFFTISVGFDVFAEDIGGWVFLIEDGAKLLGIFNWCLCFAHLSLAAILDRLQPIRAPWFAGRAARQAAATRATRCP